VSAILYKNSTIRLMQITYKNLSDKFLQHFGNISLMRALTKDTAIDILRSLCAFCASRFFLSKLLYYLRVLCVPILFIGITLSLARSLRPDSFYRDYFVTCAFFASRFFLSGLLCYLRVLCVPILFIGITLLLLLMMCFYIL
jgi:hypothetical protein